MNGLELHSQDVSPAVGLPFNGHIGSYEASRLHVIQQRLNFGGLAQVAPCNAAASLTPTTCERGCQTVELFGIVRRQQAHTLLRIA